MSACIDSAGAEEAHEVRFPNHHTGGEAANTVYIARTAA
jgi:hypothetical protein